MFWGQTRRLGLRLYLRVKVKGQGQRSTQGASGHIQLEIAGIASSQGLLFTMNGPYKVGKPSMGQGQRSLFRLKVIGQVQRSTQGASGHIQLEIAGIVSSQGLLFTMNGPYKVGEPSMGQGQRSLFRLKVKGQGQRSTQGASGHIRLEIAGIVSSHGLLFTIGPYKVGEPSMGQGQRSMLRLKVTFKVKHPRAIPI